MLVSCPFRLEVHLKAVPGQCWRHTTFKISFFSSPSFSDEREENSASPSSPSSSLKVELSTTCPQCIPPQSWAEQGGMSP